MAPKEALSPKIHLLRVVFASLIFYSILSVGSQAKAQIYEPGNGNGHGNSPPAS